MRDASRRLRIPPRTALLFAVLVAPPLCAQRMMPGPGGAGPMFGGHVGYNFDLDQTALGLQASLPMSRAVSFYPSFDYYPVNGQTYWGLNLDLALRPPVLPFYVAAGVNFLHHELTGVSETSTHLNLVGGLEFQTRRFRPYAEARFFVGDKTTFQFVGGANIPLM